MIDVEKMIDQIERADEVEIMEFDFSEVFKALRDMRKVCQMAFDDACSPSGKVSKRTSLQLMRVVDLSA